MKIGDNEPIWAAIRREWQEGLDQLSLYLAGSVTHISWTEKPDSSNDHALFFRIELRDDLAINCGKLYGTTSRIESTIRGILEPRNYRGINFYFNYRTESENKSLANQGW